MKPPRPAGWSGPRAAALGLLGCLLGTGLAARPEPLIFDTDMGNDVDDVQALALIHALQNRGLLDLLAVTTTKDHPLSAAFVDALNTFYGRPGVPVGAVRDGPTRDEGKYLGLVTRRDERGDLVYPHDLAGGADAPAAVTLLRRTLAGQPDGSVNLAQVGFSTNLARLLASPADGVSPLTGLQLVARKVKLLVVMAGSFEPGGRHLEYNVVRDIPAAKALAAGWPGPMVWSGFEVGRALPYPAAGIREDYGYVARHPVKDAYVAYCGENGSNPTWDLTCPLYIAFADRGYFDLSEPGEVRIADDGLTTFHPRADGRHRYLKLSGAQAVRVTEAFVQLCPAPPAATARPGG